MATRTQKQIRRPNADVNKIHIRITGEPFIEMKFEILEKMKKKFGVVE